MEKKEKILYHQIHPLKLATDWGTAFVALYLLWYHELILSLVVMFVPSIAVTYLMIKFVNLEKYKESPFGRYIVQYMTPIMQAIRFLGLFVMAIGAWYHVAVLIFIGLLVILLAWFRGKIFPYKVAVH